MLQPLLQSLGIALGAIAAVLGTIVSTKMFGPERRKIDADTTKVMSENMVIWIDRYRDLMDHVDALEAAQNEWFDWGRMARSVAPSLPPFPERIRRPRREGTDP